MDNNVNNIVKSSWNIPFFNFLLFIFWTKIDAKPIRTLGSYAYITTWIKINSKLSIFSWS